MLSHLTNVQARAGEAVNDIAGSVGKGVSDVIGMLMGICEEGGVREVEASIAVWAGEGEYPRLAGGVREEIIYEDYSVILY